MGCAGCGGGAHYSPGYGGSYAPPSPTVWRHTLPEGRTFEDGSTHRDFATWLEADASRAVYGGTYDNVRVENQEQGA
jgi:hypothetical protein